MQEEYNDLAYGNPTAKYNIVFDNNNIYFVSILNQSIVNEVKYLLNRFHPLIHTVIILSLLNNE